jgi:hypothetical protein
LHPLDEGKGKGKGKERAEGARSTSPLYSVPLPLPQGQAENRSEEEPQRGEEGTSTGEEEEGQGEDEDEEEGIVDPGLAWQLSSESEDISLLPSDPSSPPFPSSPSPSPSLAPSDDPSKSGRGARETEWGTLSPDGKAKLLHDLALSKRVCPPISHRLCPFWCFALTLSGPSPALPYCSS